MKQKKQSSILKKYLLFNLLVFSILGLFTYLYLKAIQPNLVKQRTANHLIIIKNTTDHLNRLKIKFETNSIKKFLFSTRFLFQSLDRVQFYNSEGNIIGDTNILDLDQRVFSKSESILEENLDGNLKIEQKKINTRLKTKNSQDELKIKNIILKKSLNEPLVIENKINKNFFVSTLKKVQIQEGKTAGYIIVTEQANDIIFAVQERKNFIIRTVLAIGLVIFIFSLFLNKYILNPIRFLVLFTEAIKAKADKPINMSKYFVRQDEIGKLTQSIDEMTRELQKRTNRAETFSTDLAHEIRNPLASLKGASELLDKTDKKERDKLLQIINHDVERIERLITDYSQMLKDEASLSREKMKRTDLGIVVRNVVEEFRQNLINQNKKLSININYKNKKDKNFFILGIENRLEQVIANLLDNSISFSKDDSQITIEMSEVGKNYQLLVVDEGPGFNEESTHKIFSRFYSNRPTKFGEHSGLGLNIVKNIVELHKGSISASNRVNSRGAQIEVLLPKSG